jgi:outer membrane lipoprotein LolB
LNRQRRSWLTTLCIGSATLAAGCTTLAPTLLSSNSLELSGRFVAKTPSESFPGRFYLRKQGNALVLELSSPFGQSMARFSQTAERSTAWVAQPSPRELQGGSLEMLSEQLLGWPVPVATLAQWLVDLQNQTTKPHASAPRSDGHWTLTVQDWFESEWPARPRLMHLTNPPTASPHIDLRLIVENWDVLP